MAEEHHQFNGQYGREEPITAATWFWADSGLDTGDICEQEVVRSGYNLRPRDFYEQEIIPAMQRTLKRCLNNLRMGVQLNATGRKIRIFRQTDLSERSAPEGTLRF